MEEWLNPITVRLITNRHINDIRWLRDHLRPEDTMELRDTETNLVEFALDERMTNYLAYDPEGVPLFVFGISDFPVTGYGHIVWCVARHDMYDHYRKDFVRLGHQVLHDWKQTYPRMWNMILDRNEKSKRWLSAMGATFSEPMLYKGNNWRLFIIEGSEADVRYAMDDWSCGPAGNQSV